MQSDSFAQESDRVDGTKSAIKKVLITGILALCLLGGLMVGNALAQDASPSVSPSPELSARGKVMQRILEPD